MKKWIKIADIIIILLVISLTFFAAYYAYIKPQMSLHIHISGKDNVWVFPINADETIEVSGPLGDTIVHLKDGSAWVESSPCDNQNCVAAGVITRQGQWTACLPNNVLLIIQGAGDSNFDGFSW